MPPPTWEQKPHRELTRYSREVSFEADSSGPETGPDDNRIRFPDADTENSRTSMNRTSARTHSPFPVPLYPHLQNGSKPMRYVRGVHETAQGLCPVASTMRSVAKNWSFNLGMSHCASICRYGNCRISSSRSATALFWYRGGNPRAYLHRAELHRHSRAVWRVAPFRLNG